MSPITGKPKSLHQTACVECEIPQLARNHYFTGKLLLERDFVDEQKFFLGKDRRHNQMLHGWGVVCGLKVKQHPNPACQSEYVVVEPGYAVDCCGREILVRCETSFNLRETVEAKLAAQIDPCGAPVELNPDDPDNPAARAHRVQICLRYRECPTEEIPALFDECGCNEKACRPNRILETFGLDVVVDAPVKPTPDPLSPTLDLQTILNVPQVIALAVDEAGERIYALTGDSPDATLADRLYVVRTTDHLVLDIFSVPGAKALALAADTSRLHVAMPNDDASALVVRVLDSSDGSQVNDLPLSVGNLGAVILATGADGNLYVAEADGIDTITVWSDAVNVQGADLNAAKLATILLGVTPTALTVTSSGDFVFAADVNDAAIRLIDVADLAGQPAKLEVAGLRPSGLAVSESTDGLRLAVTDDTAHTLRLLSVKPGDAIPFTQLGDALDLGAAIPRQVVMSSGGRWIYLGLGNGQPGVQVIDAHALALGEQAALAPLEKLVDAPTALLLGPAGFLLAAFSGGVAVFHITESDCSSIFDKALRGCPRCEEGGECLILATIDDYHLGEAVVDADIDNLTDRRWLPSTATLYKAILCIIGHCCDGGGPGQAGEQGPPGSEGPAGPGIDDVDATIVPCDQPGSASIQDIAGVRTLVLEIPRGCDGQQPPVPKFTRICGINWEHAGRPTDHLIATNELLIAFDGLVKTEDVFDKFHTFILLARHFDDRTQLTCWCEVPLKSVTAIKCDVECDPVRGFARLSPADPLGNGALLLPSGPLRAGDYRVVVKGNFIRDEQDLAVDADHLPKWLSGGRRTGDGVEGGTFESWFSIRQG